MLWTRSLVLRGMPRRAWTGQNASDRHHPRGTCFLATLGTTISKDSEFRDAFRGRSVAYSQ